MSSTNLPTATGRDTFDSTMADAPVSAVSWGAIFAGAAGAAALSLILLILGIGLGLSSVSPWSGQGITAAGIGVSTVLWLTFTQLAASGMGGYLAGRLRSRWFRTAADEVYFRDTAHGFLAWAIASLVTAAMLSSAIGSIVSTGAKVGGTVAGGAAATVTTGMSAATGALSSNDPLQGQGYFVDALFRNASTGPQEASADTATTPAVPVPDAASSTAASPAPVSDAMGAADAAQQSAEAARIFANAITSGTMPPEDTQYLGALVAQRTGLGQAEAEKRVSGTFTRLQTKLKAAETTAREAADKALKASAHAALWIFVSLLIGAFVASLMATLGGRQRDLA